jgi:uncharacterized membrane protein
MIGLREDQRVKAQLVARINRQFPVVVAGEPPVVSGFSVASGLAPHWAAQQPQNLR